MQKAEIFGTHLSCILEGDSGKKYKIEHTFPENEVWIKGEDGSDEVIVDSSGRVPFIDVKGGRKNLTAVFSGGVSLKAIPYKEAHLENY